MAKSKEPFNPFYLLVLLLGVLFAITTFAYGMMAYRAISPAAGAGDQQPGLMQFLDRHGMPILAVELLLLGIATFAAMALDQYRSKK